MFPVDVFDNEVRPTYHNIALFHAQARLSLEAEGNMSGIHRVVLPLQKRRLHSMRRWNRRVHARQIMSVLKELETLYSSERG